MALCGRTRHAPRADRSRVRQLTDTVQIYVQPRASRTAVAGRHGQAVKIRVAAPPVDGEANAELVRFLAKALGVARARVSVVGGATGRMKRVRVDGLTAAQVEAALLA